MPRRLEVLTLRGWMDRRLLSYVALGKLAGVSTRTLQEIEDGKRARPRAETVDKIADALGVKREQVMEFRRLMGLEEQ